MLRDRKYVVSQADLDMTMDVFIEENRDKLRSNLFIVTARIDNPEDRIFVFFPDDDKLGAKPIKQYTREMEDKNVMRAIVVVKDQITPFAKKVMTTIDKFKFDIFQQTELMVNITEHELVPKHVKMTPEQKAVMMARYKIADSQLPQIQKSDPVARYLGLERGDMVKIIRPSETAGRYITYRLVV